MAGHSSVETLKKLEIFTIGDLANTKPELLELHLKSHGRMLWEFANGIGNDVVMSEKSEAKGIGNSTTLPRDAETREEAAKVLLRLAESVGARLREAGQRAGMLSVEIKYYTFETASHQRQLVKQTSGDTEIYRTALELFDELWDGRPIRLLGIRSSKLAGEDEPEQLSIFDLPSVNERKKLSHVEPEMRRSVAVPTEKQKKLDKALDEIKRKFGDQAVQRGRFLQKPGVDRGDKNEYNG